MNRTQKATQGWVLALTSAAALMVALDQLVVATALSTIRRDLHASIETLEWTVNAFTLTFAVLLMTGAALGDRLGRRRMFVTGLTLFTAASAACALAPGIGWLIVARAVQGMGSALVMPLAMALLSAAFPPETRGRALGVFTGLTGVAVVGGPVVGGAITENLAWQWIFWVNIPIGLLVIPLVLTRIDESHGPQTRIDALGLVLATGGALGLVWGLVRGNSQGWASTEIVATLAAGALLCVAFVAWEMRARAPMLPMQFFRIPAFAGRKCGRVPAVCVPVQLGVLRGAIPAGLARVRAAGRGAAHPALDFGHLLRRADGRGARGPDRLPARSSRAA